MVRIYRKTNSNKLASQRISSGSGVVNSLINNLPFELHLPGYSYCGPGTKLQERLKRNDPGINGLDEACKEHDIAYSKHKDIETRHIADKILEEKAWRRVKAKDSRLGERLNAILVTNTMKAKTKLGMGNKSLKTKKICGKKIFQRAIKIAKKSLKTMKNPSDIGEGVKIARNAFRKVLKRNKSLMEIPRVIPVPKIGGILPLIPIFAGLSALGALTGGVTQIVKTIKDVKNANEQLVETNRHNKQMEAVALGKGLHLKPYKKGNGLYLRSSSKNF